VGEPMDEVDAEIRPGSFTMPADWTHRYLALLGVEQEAPVLDALTHLTRAHVLTIPFENVTSILRRQASPVPHPVVAIDPEATLQRWERRAGGGVCFDMTEMLSRLLMALGYQAYPVAAGRVDPTGWHGGHQAMLVTIDGIRYLVDVGNGTPFLEPIPLDRTFEVHRAGLAYRFRADDASDGWVRDHWIDGAWSPFCVFDLRPAGAPLRAAAYQRHHTPGASWVVGGLVLIRSGADEVYSLRGDQLSWYTPAGKHVEQLTSDADYERVASAVLGLPALPVLQARLALQAWVPG
jgi:N-hydroxyarylamine O-acetyltransferase